MNPRNGKIARLPREIQEELNQRLECSEQGPQLLDWLNSLQEVKKAVKDHFAGVPISKQNLSEWRQGGFQEWLVRRDICEEASDVAGLAEKMSEECFAGVLADDVATVLAARFGGLIARWDGEVDAKFEAKTRVLNRLCRSVVQLQRGMHRAKQEQFEMERLQAEKEKAEEEELKKKLTSPLFDMVRAGPMAKYFGGGTAGRKMAEYVLAIQSGRLNTELDLLPTDTYANEEPVPAKPIQKQRTAQKARKTKPDNADNTLEENEMEDEEEPQTDSSDPSESDSVKPSQTDLVREEDEGAGLGSGTKEG